MIVGIPYRVEHLSQDAVNALIGRRVVAVSEFNRSEEEFPRLAIGTVVSGTRDESRIRMYVQFDDDDEIGLFEDEYFVLLDDGVSHE